MPFEKVETPARRFPRPRAPGTRASGRTNGIFDQLRRKNAGKPQVVLPRRPDHRQQPDGRAPRLGPHVQGRLQPLLRHDRPRPPLPERLRLPGSVGRGRSREGTRAQDQARHREPGSGDRERRSRSSCKLCKDRVDKFARVQTEQSIRLGYWMDWDRTDADWAKPPDERQVVLHHVRGEQLHDLGVPQEVPRARA